MVFSGVMDTKVMEPIALVVVGAMVVVDGNFVVASVVVEEGRIDVVVSVVGIVVVVG